MPAIDGYLYFNQKKLHDVFEMTVAYLRLNCPVTFYKILLLPHNITIE